MEDLIPGPVWVMPERADPMQNLGDLILPELQGLWQAADPQTIMLQGRRSIAGLLKHVSCTVQMLSLPGFVEDILHLVLQAPGGWLAEGVCNRRVGLDVDQSDSVLLLQGLGCGDYLV